MSCYVYCVSDVWNFFGESITSPVPQNVTIGTRDTIRTPVQINILNGCGINGVGQTLMAYCRKAGYDVVEMGNYKSFDIEHSIVIDRSGKPELALQLAKQIGIAEENIVTQFSSEYLVAASVVIGKDYKELLPWK